MFESQLAVRRDEVKTTVEHQPENVKRDEM